jgi:hypothetical protein
MEFNVGWNTDMFPYLFRYRLQYRTSVVRHQQFFLCEAVKPTCPGKPPASLYAWISL